MLRGIRLMPIVAVCVWVFIVPSFPPPIIPLSRCSILLVFSLFCVFFLLFPLPQDRDRSLGCHDKSFGCCSSWMDDVREFNFLRNVNNFKGSKLRYSCCTKWIENHPQRRTSAIGAKVFLSTHRRSFFLLLFHSVA